MLNIKLRAYKRSIDLCLHWIK